MNAWLIAALALLPGLLACGLVCGLSDVLDGLVALVMTFAQGAQAERLLGIDDGHAELLAWIEHRLESVERRGER